MLWGPTSQDLRRGSEEEDTFGLVEEYDLVRRRRGVRVEVVEAESSMVERRSQRQEAQKPVMGLVVG